jgi:hypothetical protein
MEPLIAIRIHSATCVFHPGDTLDCDFQIEAVPAADVQTVEIAVMWFTEGKGEEDLGVHYFERYTAGDAVDGDLRQLTRFQTRLPASPLTYHGAIVKIRWRVRVRVFWERGKETFADRVFQLVATDGEAASDA